MIKSKKEGECEVVYGAKAPAARIAEAQAACRDYRTNGIKPKSANLEGAAKEATKAGVQDVANKAAKSITEAREAE